MGSTRRGYMKRPCGVLKQCQEEYGSLSLYSLLCWIPVLCEIKSYYSVQRYICLIVAILSQILLLFSAPSKLCESSCFVIIWGYCIWILTNWKFNIYLMTWRGIAWTIRSTGEDPALVSPPSSQVPHFEQQHLDTSPFVSKQFCRKDLGNILYNLMLAFFKIFYFFNKSFADL